MRPRGSRLAVHLAMAASLGLASLAAPARAELTALGEPERVDGVAAVVGGTGPGEGVLLILRSDVELRARLSLLAAGAADPVHALLPPDLLQATLSELLGESLIVIEASRLSIALPSPDEVRNQRMRLAASTATGLGLPQLITTWGLAEAELSEIARRRAIVGAFLAANLEGTLEVSDTELLRAFQNEQHPFKDQPFEQAEPLFSLWYAQRSMQESVARWVLSLKDRTPHRVIWTF